MTRNILQTFLFIVICASSKAQNNYPATKTVDSSDTYFGVTYKDPYRWLENLKDSNVVNWFRLQKEFADKKMEKIDGIDSLLNQIQYFLDAKTWRREPYWKTASRYYYMIWKKGQLSQKLYYKTINDTTEHLLFDTWDIHPGMRYELYDIALSPNEKYFFAAFDKNGEE